MPRSKHMGERVYSLINRWAFLPLAVAIMAPTVAPQDSVEKFKTSGFVNGRFWEALDEAGKIAFIFGFYEGVFSGTMVSSGDLSAAMEEFSVKRFNYEEHVKEIDKFYASRENILIPIHAALHYCAEKLRGTHTNAELEQMLINMRTGSLDIPENTSGPGKTSQ